MVQGGRGGGIKLLVTTVEAHWDPRQGTVTVTVGGVLVVPWPCQMDSAPSSVQHQERSRPLPSTAWAWQVQTPILGVAFV